MRKMTNNRWEQTKNFSQLDISIPSYITTLKREYLGLVLKLFSYFIILFFGYQPITSITYRLVITT